MDPEATNLIYAAINAGGVVVERFSHNLHNSLPQPAAYVAQIRVTSFRLPVCSCAGVVCTVLRGIQPVYAYPPPSNLTAMGRLIDPVHSADGALDKLILRSTGGGGLSL